MVKSTGFKQEYRKYIIDYIFKLIGEDRNKAKVEDYEKEDDEFENFDYKYENHKKYILFGIKSNILFRSQIRNTMDEDDVSLIKNIITHFLKVAVFNQNGEKQHNYLSNATKNANYEHSLQTGICEWLVGGKVGFEKMEDLLNILEKWSVKTYEGRSVSYGIVINAEDGAEVKDAGGKDFLSFLKDEFSAVLTDPISSVFELDVNCNYIGYKTVIDTNENNYIESFTSFKESRE